MSTTSLTDPMAFVGTPSTTCALVTKRPVLSTQKPDPEPSPSLLLTTTNAVAALPRATTSTSAAHTERAVGPSANQISHTLANNRFIVIPLQFLWESRCDT